MLPTFAWVQAAFHSQTAVGPSGNLPELCVGRSTRRTSEPKLLIGKQLLIRFGIGAGHALSDALKIGFTRANRDPAIRDHPRVSTRLLEDYQTARGLIIGGLRRSPTHWASAHVHWHAWKRKRYLVLLEQARGVGRRANGTIRTQERIVAERAMAKGCVTLNRTEK